MNMVVSPGRVSDHTSGDTSIVAFLLMTRQSHYWDCHALVCTVVVSLHILQINIIHHSFELSFLACALCSIVYYYNALHTWVQSVVWLHRALNLLGLALLSSEHVYSFGLNDAVFFVTFCTFWIGLWPGWQLNVLHAMTLFGYLTCKATPEMTYNMLHGTLNPTIP